MLVAIRVAALLALLIIVATTPGFFTAVSLFSLLNTTSFIGCVAIGMTFITLSGNIMSFALSVTLSTSGMVFISALPLGLPAALIVAFAYGGALTGFQGAVIGYFRANPIIVSMAALALITGCATLITQGQGIYPQGDAAAALKGSRARHSDAARRFDPYGRRLPRSCCRSPVSGDSFIWSAATGGRRWPPD